MNLFNNKKANAVLHIGAGGLLLFLIVVFIFIALADPTLATEIVTAIGTLTTALRGG